MQSVNVQGRPGYLGLDIFNRLGIHRERRVSGEQAGKVLDPSGGRPGKELHWEPETSENAKPTAPAMVDEI